MWLRRGGSAKLRSKARASKQIKREPLKFRQLYRLVHRFAILVGAIAYIVLSFLSANDAMGLLRGHNDPFLPEREGSFPLITVFAGTATLRESRLVKLGLQDSTAPVSGALYLESSDSASFAKCTDIPDIQRDIYDDTFLQSVYHAIAEGTGYKITELSDATTELIAPIVDCAASDVFDGDATSSRLYFLVRRRNDPQHVSLVVVSLSIQQYSVPAQGENGPAGVATLQIIHDMRQSVVPHFYIISERYPFEDFDFRVFDYLTTTESGQWTLQGVPADDDEIAVIMQTSSRGGFYIKAESEQSNVNNQVWLLDQDPVLAISRWRWFTKPVLRDSWAWVHAIQFVIGLVLLANLVILSVATYRNVRAGKWWIGDAFVSISTSQIANGVLVLVSWFMNEYWVLHEFCFYIGYELSGVAKIHVYENPMRASTLTIYLSACGIIGQLFHERVDPFFAMLCFFIGFESRIAILKGIPALHDSIHEFATYSYMRGVSDSVDGQATISPMRLWTTHPIGERNYTFVFECLFPIYASLLLIVVYIIVRKVYRFVYPDPLHIQHTGKTPTNQSVNEDAMIAQKRILTLFEVATGAELENRFGLVSDYETCIYIKGMKFASADGIYSTGFVIANKKYLLQTSDYWSIVLMKILRRRFRNIYVYDVNGSTVQQTARLVYPHTLTVQDLLNINVSVLS